MEKRRWEQYKEEKCSEKVEKFTERQWDDETV
jgi:hypothetical protein